MALGTLTAIAGGVGALGGILGAGSQRKAEKRAQKQLADTLQNQEQFFGEQQEFQRPFYNAGAGAMPGYQYMSTGEAQEGYTPQDVFNPEQRDIYNRMSQSAFGPVTETDEYQWRADETDEAINQAMAARGMHNSSAAVNMIADQRRALGSEMEGQRYSRLGGLQQMLGGAEQNRYNRLAGMTNMGMQAGGQQSQNLGNWMNTLGGYGQQMAGSQRQMGNIDANMWSGLGNAPMQGLGAYTAANQAMNPFGGGQGQQGGGQGVTNEAAMGPVPSYNPSFGNIGANTPSTPYDWITLNNPGGR